MRHAVSRPRPTAQAAARTAARRAARALLRLAVPAMLAAVPAAAQPALDNPYMTFKDRTESTARATIEIRSFGNFVLPGVGVSNPQNIVGGNLQVSGGTIFFPAPKRTAASIAHDNGIRGAVAANSNFFARPVTLAGDIEETTKLFPAGARYAELEVGSLQAPTFLAFQFEMRHSLFNTVFNETAAAQLPWPETLPPEAAAALEPQPLVSVTPEGESVREPVADLLTSMIGDNDIREITPLAAAKYLTAELIYRFRVQAEVPQVPGGFLNRNNALLQTSGRVTELRSLAITDAGTAANRLTGSRFTLVNLWVALMREAGIPARVVVGFDLGSALSIGRFEFDTIDPREPGVIAWAEFALYDQASDILTWVPVDVYELDQQTNQRQNWQQPWNFFGTHPYLSTYVPIAHAWYPPMSATVFGFSLWGWDAQLNADSGADLRVRFEQFAVQQDGRTGRGPALLPARGLASGKATER
ncbi:MAG: transglutaminase-like domain-containing protein [Planctomycetota bacterium]